MPLSPLGFAQNTHARATSRGCGSLASDLMRSRPGRRAHGGRAFNWPCRAHDRPRMCPRIASPDTRCIALRSRCCRWDMAAQYTNPRHATGLSVGTGPARRSLATAIKRAGGFNSRAAFCGAGLRASGTAISPRSSRCRCRRWLHQHWPRRRTGANGPDPDWTTQLLPPPARDGHLGPRPIRLKRSFARAFGDVGPDPNR